MSPQPMERKRYILEFGDYMKRRILMFHDCCEFVVKTTPIINLMRGAN